MFATIKKLLALIRFSHTLFAMPFALLAAMMAWRLRVIELAESLGYASGRIPIGIPTSDGGFFLTTEHYLQFGSTRFSLDWMHESTLMVRWQELVGIVLCMITARSAAMAFNRIADRKIDAANPRTAGRHLPAGTLSVAQVTTFAAACGLAFIASTLLFLPNRLPLYLSIPVLVFLMGYSYAKRFTPFSHVWLGAALALSPIAAWTAIRGEAVLQHAGDLLPALLLGGAVLAWVAGFDMLYACQDIDFDRRAQLHSIPVRLGILGALRLAAGCHLLTVLLLALLPLVYPPFGLIFWLGTAAVAVLLVYEHALVRPDNLERVNIAFFNINAVISLGLLAVGTLDLWVS